MHALETVLSLPTPAMYLCLGDHLRAAVDSLGIEGLPQIERILWLGHELESAMCRGGLHDYSISPAWEHAALAIRAIAELGAPRSAEILHDAIAAREAGDFVEFDKLSALMARVQEDLQGLICDYARRHRAELLKVQ
jgi:hypothetical protein